MAYMNQERKATIAAELKKIIPAGWKYSLSVRHHSTIVLTIAAAPVDFIAEANERNRKMAERTGGTFYEVKDSFDLNHHHFDAADWPQSGKVMEKIIRALNKGNHDRSDLQTDYFDVGWYIDISIGRWNKPFQHIAEMKQAA